MFAGNKNRPVGCADHNDPNCLCDVIITQTVPIQIETMPKYWDVALHELEDDTVNERNVHEFFQIVMGLAVNEWQIDNLFEKPRPGSPWARFPRPVRDAIAFHSRAGTPWSLAKQELEGHDVDADEMVRLAKSYTSNMHGQRKDAADKGEMRYQTSYEKRSKSASERKHGTPSAYDAHRRDGEDACDECRQWSLRRGAKRRQADKLKASALPSLPPGRIKYRAQGRTGMHVVPALTREEVSR